jgi:hypothetical protein
MDQKSKIPARNAAGFPYLSAHIPVLPSSLFFRIYAHVLRATQAKHYVLCPLA